MPIIQTTLPIVVTTLPIIQTTLPIITTTLPVIQTTLPIITTTTPIIGITVNLVETTTFEKNIISSLPSEDNLGEIYDSSQKLLVSSTENENNQISTVIKSSQMAQEDITEKNTGTQKNDFISSIETNNNIFISSILTPEKPKCNYNNYVNNKCSFFQNNIVYTEDSFIKDIILSYPIINGKSITKTDNNVTIQITTGENEMACLKEGICDENQSVIDLSECEILLRNKYHIGKNVTLIYLKSQNNSNKTYEKNIQYEVYEPINKTKLDLSICQNTSVDIYIPIKLTKKTQRSYDSLKNSGYDLFNLNDPFYLQICTPYKSENGTDVLLEDRKNDYYYSSINETTCQSNCHNFQYLSDSKFLKCECSITNETIDTTDYKKFEPKKFYNAFYDILKYSNYKVLRCYNLAFHIDSVTINYGSIIVIILFFFYLIAFIKYVKNGITPLKIEMMKRIFEAPIKEKVKKYNSEKPENDYSNIFSQISTSRNKMSTINLNNKGFKNDNKNLNKKPNPKPIIFQLLPNFASKNKNINNPTSKRKSHGLLKNKKTNSNQVQLQKTNKFNKSDKNKNNKYHTIIIQKMNIIQNQNSRNSKSKFNEKFEEKGTQNNLQTESENEKIELKYDNFELNNMEYEEALQYDKRSMIRSYWSIINREHLILLTFFSKNDFNLSYVKFARFIFLISTSMALNVFLFSDETMHKTYLSYGQYDFVQHIAQIIMTTVFSQIMEVFICYLSLTDSSIYKIKDLARNDAQKQENLEQIFDIIKCMNKKIKFFFAFTFILIAFYWYSVACFCAVYRNTQIIFLTDCGLSFLMELLEPFILYAIPSILRAISLKCKNNSCMYKLSDMIPIF